MMDPESERMGMFRPTRLGPIGERAGLGWPEEDGGLAGMKMAPWSMLCPDYLLVMVYPTCTDTIS